MAAGRGEGVRGCEIGCCARGQAILKPEPRAGGGGQGRRSRVGVPVHAEGLCDGDSAQVAHAHGQGEEHVCRRRERVGSDVLHHQVGLRQRQHRQRDGRGVAEQTAVGYRRQRINPRRRGQRRGEGQQTASAGCDRVGHPIRCCAGGEPMHAQLHRPLPLVLGGQVRGEGDRQPLGDGPGGRHHGEGEVGMGKHGQGERRRMGEAVTGAGDDQPVITQGRRQRRGEGQCGRVVRRHRVRSPISRHTGGEPAHAQLNLGVETVQRGERHHGGHSPALAHAACLRRHIQRKVRVRGNGQREGDAVYPPAAGAGQHQGVVAYRRGQGRGERDGGGAGGHYWIGQDRGGHTVRQTAHCQHHRLGEIVQAGHGGRVDRLAALGCGLRVGRNI